MHQWKTLTLATAAAALFGLAPLPALADESELSRQLNEARQEGALWTVYALNRHLNPFDIKVDVENGRATLSGSVESEVERDLAEQLALGIEGVNKVDNQLLVDPRASARSDDRPSLAQRFDDATLAATVKSRLLWNSNTDGLDIQVKARDGEVTLTGNAETPAAKELAGALAANTEGVREVFNHLSVSRTDSAAEQAQNAAANASEAISDAWITSKVKSSFLYSRNLDGLRIAVATEDGLVSLSGTVLSDAEKQLAVETARNIRGVRGVDADALLVDG